MINQFNELSTTSESDSEYLVDSRYCRTTVKCKRKALKKTIKLIHGRCVVIYRGSGDLLPIAAKDADRNCYCGNEGILFDWKVRRLNRFCFRLSWTKTNQSSLTIEISFTEFFNIGWCKRRMRWNVQRIDLIRRKMKLMRIRNDSLNKIPFLSKRKSMMKIQIHRQDKTNSRRIILYSKKSILMSMNYFMMISHLLRLFIRLQQTSNHDRET